MERRELKAWLGIISGGRPHAVPAMRALVGDATWYVRTGEAAVYTAAGAAHVVEAGALCRARNQALIDGHGEGLPVVQLSDDMSKLERAVWSEAKGKHVAEPLEFGQAVDAMLRAMRDTGTKLAGVAPTSNPFYYTGTRPVNTRAFVVGDFIAVAPPATLDEALWFDEGMKLKEDYDYTLQHLSRHGGVARLDWVLASFAHRTNKGGAVDYRTAELEQQAIAQLRARWGTLVADNPRRPNEILLKLPKVR